MSTPDPVPSTVPAAPAAAAAPAPPAPPAKGKRRRALIIVALIFVVIAVIWLLLWLLVFSRRETTDDAYVGGDQVGIAAQIQGTVVQLLVDDTQRVDAGQLVARLDDTDTQVALAHAASVLAQAVRQVRQQQATAAQLDAEVESRRAQLEQADAQLARRVPLLSAQAIAEEEVKQAQTTMDVARTSVKAAQAQAAAAHALIDGVSLDKNPMVLEARAAYEQAWMAVRRTRILAPVSGYVAQRTIQIGAQVQPGQILLNVVPLERLWVDANFKEGQLRNLRIGQSAEVKSDVYGGSVVFHGKVLGAAAGTGAAFSLLPAQNASGNWIKVVQRVPVRITLDPKELADHPLRIGLSTDVKVSIVDRSGPVLAAAPADKTVASTTLYDGDAAAAAQAADAILHGQTAPGP
jgi:membrane fusion protein (multidrug efflux system)